MKIPTIKEIKHEFCISHFLYETLETPEATLLALDAVEEEEMSYPEGIVPCDIYQDYSPYNLLTLMEDMACHLNSYIINLTNK